MDSLLPSEIARLVLGYLEDQKCDEAAKTFLETSPHLEECRMVHARGKRFTRTFSDMTLTDILDKYSAIHAFVHEKLSRVSDGEQLKQSGNFLDEIRLLIEGSPRSQRFFVNIKVPTQNAVTASSGSPIISSNMRKRQRSGSDRERDRSKRFAKLHPEATEKINNPDNIQLHCNATPAESLPGHIDSSNSNAEEKFSSLKQRSKESLNLGQSEPNDHEKISNLPGTSTRQLEGALPFNQNPPKNNTENNVKYNNFQETSSKCTMSTSTEELIRSYPSTGVQTVPWDVPDLAPDLMTNYESLQNLSLLSKELLNRKELHERIADNINKGILPVESTPFKEGAYGANSSFLGMNNSDVLKSIVEATEQDPRFEQFIRDFIEPIPGTDTRPGENLASGNKPELIEREKHQELDENILNGMNLSIPHGDDNRIEQSGGLSEMPLKERLRNSSRQQNEKQVDQEKEVKSLEDQNAAAIQSIINANFAYTVSQHIEPPCNEPQEIENNPFNMIEVSKESESNAVDSGPQLNSVDLNICNTKSNDSVQIIELPPNVDKPSTQTTESKTTVTNVKGQKISKRKEMKPVKKVPSENQEKVLKEEMMVMPTLIRCNKDDSGSFLAVMPSYSKTHSVLFPTASNSQFIPIASKHSTDGVHRPIYCKTVQVARRILPEKPKNTENAKKSDKVEQTEKSKKQLPQINPPVLQNTGPVTMSNKLSLGLQNHAPAVLPQMMPVTLPQLLPVGLPTPQPIIVSQANSVALSVETKILPMATTVTFPNPATVAPASLSLDTPVLFTEPNVSTHVIHQSLKSFPNIEMHSCDNYSKPSNTQTEFFKDPEVNEPYLEASNFKELNATEIMFQEPSVKESEIVAPSSVTVSENRMQALESITLYANENSKPSLLDVAGLPSFSVDDSLSFSISGLSPYLKPKKNKEAEKKDTSTGNVNKIENVTNVLSTSSILKRSDVITRRTPKSLIKSRSKNHRLSLSTPRRRSSHVRVLDFGTPPKSSSSAKKSICKGSPGTLNHSKSNCRTSLFKSPPFSNSLSVSQKLKSPGKDSRSYKVPIATRSPLPKLKGGWEKYTGVDMILGGASPNSNSNPSFIDKQDMQPPPSAPPPPKPNPKKSWDADLRLAVAATSEESNKTDKVEKAERRPRKIKTPSKGKKGKSLVSRENKKKNSKTPAKSTISSDQEATSSENVSDPTGLIKVPSINNIPSSTPAKPQVDQSTSELLETFEPVPKPVEISPTSKPSTSKISPTMSKNMIKIMDKTYGEKIKKYAQLTSIPRTATKVNSEFLKFSQKNTSKFVKMPNLKELETPQKLENSRGIPQTPRFLSPTSCSLTPLSKITHSEDSSKLPGVYLTPDCFPPTPSIVFTPNLAGENTNDVIKKEHNACSPYYQPSSELGEDAEKQLRDSLKTMEIRTVVINTCDTKVTEFQVIKGNLPKEEAAKEELRISSSSIEVSGSITITEEVSVSSTFQDVEVPMEVSAESVDKSSQNSDDDSSNSESNSSSSFSSTSSSSSSGSSNSSATETPISAAKNNKTCTDVSGESIQITSPGVIQEDKVPVEEEHVENREAKDYEISDQEIKDSEIKVPEIKETSPQKIFSVTNTEDNEEKETPAKNDLLLEADISETPSSSKVGTETPTNLSTKISAIMVSNQIKAKNMELKVSSKPTIVSIERISPIDCNAFKVAQILSNSNDSKPGPSLQGRTANPVDENLKLELEMKRERLKSFLGGHSRGKAIGRGAAGRRGRYSVGRKAVHIVNLKNAKIEPPAEENEPNENDFKLKEGKPVSKDSLKKEEKSAEEEIKSETDAKFTRVDKEEDKDLQNIEEGQNLVTTNAKKGKTLKKTKPPKLTTKKEQISESKEPANKADNKLVSKNKIKDKVSLMQIESEVKEIVLNLEEQKCNIKAKVDLVKRDLFSDEEAVDQRTTRSKSRQISDAQKSDISDQNVDQVKNSTLSSPEILECLQLVPANKSEILDESFGLQNATDSNQRVYNFVYDERPGIKKRKRKFSQSDLEVYIEGEDNDGKLLTTTPFKEIFNIIPKPKKRVRKKPVRSIKETVEPSNYEHPLATSSPILKLAMSQTVGKNEIEKKKNEAGERDNAKNEKGKAVIEKEKQKGKCRKRKASSTQEQELEKPKLKDTIPEVLDNLNVDEFLAKLHGPR